MDDWIGVLMGVLSITYVGDILMRVLFRSDRRVADAKADKAEAEANEKEWELEEKRISELCNTIEWLNKQLDAYVERDASKEERFDRQTERLREVQRQFAQAQDRIIEITRENGQLELRLAYWKQWHCRRDVCADGRLPSNPSLTGQVFNENYAEKGIEL